MQPTLPEDATGTLRRVWEWGESESMAGSSKGSVRTPPRWFVTTAWKVHRALYKVTNGLPRQVSAHLAQGPERDRLWALWRTIEPNLDEYAALRSTPTAVVVVACTHR